MAENNRESESIARQKPDQAPKKPYEPPKVVSHHQVEVIAGTCTPSPPGKRTVADTDCTFASS